MNRLSSVTQTNRSGGNTVAPKLASFQYNLASQLSDLRRYSDTTGIATNLEVHTRNAYDPAGRLTSFTHGKTEIAAGQNWTGTSAVPASLGSTNMLAGYFLTYDQDNRVTGLSSWRDAFKTSYVYNGTASGTGTNSTDELASATSAVIPGITLPNPLPAAESYNLDANGNRRTAGGTSQSAAGTHNRLQSDGTFAYDYDNEGNVTRRTRTSNGQVTDYTWDHRNRMTSVTDKVTATGATTKKTEFIYDAFDQRVGKRLDSGTIGDWDRYEVYVWADGQEVLRFVDSDGQVTIQPFRLSNRYLWGNAVDQLLSDEQYASGTGPDVNATVANTTGGNTLWALTDHLGSVRDLVDNNGVIREHNVYDSFGRLIREVDYDAAGAVIASTSAAAVDTIFGYTARDFDADVGLQYNRARWYDPANGRWLSQDPIGFGGGDANLYRYVGNGPTGATDPSGLEVRGVGDLLPKFKKYLDKDLNILIEKGKPGYTRALILQGLFKSNDTFVLKGDTIEENVKNLVAHVDARREVLKSTYRKKFKFGAGDKWKENHTTAPEPTMDDPRAYYDSINNSGTSIACLQATELVMAVGNGSTKGMMWRKIVDESDFIPGDWGYIYNDAHQWHVSADDSSMWLTGHCTIKGGTI
jgi:RHS repeat-associated protein